jgi:hypothetical protein
MAPKSTPQYLLSRLSERRLRHHLATAQINSIKPALPYVKAAGRVGVSEIKG